MSSRADQTIFLHVRERFETRAKALFYARLTLMAIWLGVLLVPAWHRALNISLPTGAYFYLAVLAYHVVSYLWVGRRFAPAAIFVTLCCDLLVFLFLVAYSGGIKSSLMPTQLVFTMLFALLYPSPLAIIPPLLTLPVLAKIDQILGIQILPNDLLLLLWYSALNITVVYVVVYLEIRERSAFQEVIRLQRERRQAALDSERTRIAREIHDSVGAALSSVMLQAEYLVTRSSAPELKGELDELREVASTGMDELRRAVSVMRKEFHLPSAAEEYLRAFGNRHRLLVEWRCEGPELDLGPEPQLVLFRILQESLANIAQHARASKVEVTLSFNPQAVTLRVVDDGQGFLPDQVEQGHFGLRNMRERAARIDGALEISSTPGKGTSIQVRVSPPSPGFDVI